MSAPRAVRTFPLRWHLLLLVVGTLTPLVIFAGVMLVRVAQEERQEVEQRLLLSAKSMAEEVDREITGSQRTLEALAELAGFDGPDLAGFHAEARRVVVSQPSWRAVTVYTPDGRQVLNTRVDWGNPLPGPLEPLSLRATLESRRPTVGVLAQDADGAWAFPVRVPVFRGGELRYVLTTLIEASALESLAARASTREEWLRAILDSDGVVAARAKEPDRFVGRVGRVTFLARVAAETEGVFRDETFEGIPVDVAFCRARRSGWTAAVSASAASLEAPVQGVMLGVTIFGVVTLGLAGVVAWVFARRVERGITAAAEAAAAMAHGERPIIGPSRIKEVSDLGDSLWRSSELLRQRERERDEQLVKLSAATSKLRELKAQGGESGAAAEDERDRRG